MIRSARSWLLYGIVALVFLLVLGQLALAYLMLEPNRCDAESTSCFDSGWQPVSNKATSTYFFRHKLAGTPRRMSVWFSPTKDGAQAFPLLWKFQRNETGNPVSIETVKDVIYVHVWNGVPIFGAYDARTDRWTTYTDGFYRVIAER